MSFRKKSSTTHFNVQSQNSVMIKEKEQQLPFANGEENIPPRVQKRSAHFAKPGFCCKPGCSLLKMA